MSRFRPHNTPSSFIRVSSAFASSYLNWPRCVVSMNSTSDNPSSPAIMFALYSTLFMSWNVNLSLASPSHILNMSSGSTIT